MGVLGLAGGREIEKRSDQDLLSISELSPSLLNLEAERLKIDPNHIDQAGLRRNLYAELSKRCLQQSDSKP